jgi:4-hydroxybenzoate polyprenyltransferase
LLVAIAGVGAGYAYDLWLKGTPASWAPFAMGIPLLPVFAWQGSTGTVPVSFALLVPLAALSGFALALANALADLERDLATGTPTLATRLGPRRAWRLHAVLHATVVAAALVALTLAGRVPWFAVAASLAILAGVVLAAEAGPRRRELGWEIQAAGTGVLGIAWLAALGMGD